MVLFAGKLLPFKRPLDVIEAVAQLRRDGRKLSIIVAGSGELDATMRQRAQALGVTLHMLGFQNQTQMPACYAASDLLALPSDARETWGLVANEALACGRGIVLSDAVGAAPDLAVFGGGVYPMGDASALAQTIARVLDHPPPAAAIAAKAAAHSPSAAADGVLAAMQFTTAAKARRDHAADERVRS